MELQQLAVASMRATCRTLPRVAHDPQAVGTRSTVLMASWSWALVWLGMVTQVALAGQLVMGALKVQLWPRVACPQDVVEAPGTGPAQC